MSNSRVIDISKIVNAETAATEGRYDVVIVGSGVAGSILATEISRHEHVRILIVEAGPGGNVAQKGFQRYVENFYSAVSKDNNAPYPANPNAEMPRGPAVQSLRPGQPNSDAYWVQNGPFVSDSVYTRVLGGTTMHWEGKTPRMLRDDFKMKTKYGQGLDWPIEIDELHEYYNLAERELGVSGNVESQRALGVEFDPGYVYPMHEMPPSYLDQVVAKDFNGTKVQLDGEEFELSLRTFPQARNGVPNEAYAKFNEGKPYVPVGAVSLHRAEEGERCQGNTNCVPICPVQAKYDARKTLARALATGRVDIIPQAVASQVQVDSKTNEVTSIVVKVYDKLDNPAHQTITIKAKLFILAANAVENARLMLASGLPSTSRLMGKNLMDHPFLLAWGLLREEGGTGRGPLVTSGVCELRNGRFRRRQAGFAMDIHNDGWGWANGAPVSTLMGAVDNMNKYGKELRDSVRSHVSRQLLLAFMVEMLPEEANRVSVDPTYLDALGNMKPVISYRIPDYSMNAMVYARQFSRMLFQRVGAEDHTKYDLLDPGYVSYEGEGFAIRGGNHLSGTHIMGTDKYNSVVDSYQKSWDHDNLYLTGAGSMPSIGTSNTTVTLAALCYRTSRVILKRLAR